jgi:hypothetical protein
MKIGPATFSPVLHPNAKYAQAVSVASRIRRTGRLPQTSSIMHCAVSEKMLSTLLLLGRNLLNVAVQSLLCLLAKASSQ